MTSDPGSSQQPAFRTSRARARLIACLVIFLAAVGVRVLTWHDTRLEVGKVQSVVVADYQRVAGFFRVGGVSSFFSRSSPLADPNTLGHPPGYSLLIALVFSVKQSEAAVQFVQIAADALSAVLLFLIISELLTLSAGVIAGLLAALSPQLAWNSVLLLPDSISVLPILLAVYLLARGAKNPRVLTFIVTGALIGLSCWLRANAMLLTLFFAAATLLLVQRKRWQFALAVICGTLLIVLPLTIRNAIVFHRFIPLSLGAGQTLLEGIGDYDKDARFGVPNTDMGIMKQEAEIYQRPDYYGTLFNPDGVERERARLARGFAIVRAHPFWFAGVMARRASSMLRLERSRLLSRAPAIVHSRDPNSRPAVIQYSFEILNEANPRANQLTHQKELDANILRVVADDSRYGIQTSWPLRVKRNNDYILLTQVKVEAGRIRFSVIDSNDDVLSSTTIEPLEGKTGVDAYVPLELPFVAADDSLRIVVSNEGSPNSLFSITSIEVYELGAARFLWTRYPRFLIHGIQRMFITAVILPLSIIGLLVVIFKSRIALVILSVVPIYFFTVQSAFHTEYRYVIAVTYCLFAFAGFALGFGIDLMLKKLTTLVKSSSAMRSVPSA